MKSKENDIDEEIDFSEEAFNKRFRRIEGDELTELKARIAGARRGTKSRLTIYLDSDIVTHFKKLAEREGAGYQTLINNELRKVLTAGKGRSDKHITKDDLLKDKKFLRKLRSALAS